MTKSVSYFFNLSWAPIFDRVGSLCTEAVTVCRKMLTDKFKR
jgi:hypothetical protein